MSIASELKEHYRKSLSRVLEVAIYKVVTFSSFMAAGSYGDGDDELARDLEVIDTLVSMGVAFEDLLIDHDFFLEPGLFDAGKQPIFGGFL